MFDVYWHNENRHKHPPGMCMTRSTYNPLLSLTDTENVA